jgi:hypothetical protein
MARRNYEELYGECFICKAMRRCVLLGFNPPPVQDSGVAFKHPHYRAWVCGCCNCDPNVEVYLYERIAASEAG